MYTLQTEQWQGNQRICTTQHVMVTISAHEQATWYSAHRKRALELLQRRSEVCTAGLALKQRCVISTSYWVNTTTGLKL